ncbi:MAG: PDZ domain-containing protein [Gammaproteobacteria bacterium]|nr:PDZ domain-containing protein [Gammaproteobacteria bacterium]
MKRFLLLLLTAIVLIVILSLFIGEVEKSNKIMPGDSAQRRNVNESDTRLFRTASETDGDKILRLENEIAELKLRLNELEAMVSHGNEQDGEHKNETSTVAAGAAPIFKSMSADMLKSVGVRAEIAEDIMRRSSEQEYKKLELRDRAIRDGYLNKPEYYRQLRELNNQSISLRDELGDTVYDRYLYATGQNNRIQVASVMQGSPAELAGIQPDDIVLSYGSQSILHYSDIRQATSQGELTDYVTVNILRDGELVNVMLPRGPMGIRLQATRVEPRSD